MQHAFTKCDVESVISGFLELKAGGMSFSGWEVRRDLMV